MFQQLLMLFGFFSLVLALVFWVNRAVGLLDWLMGDGQSAGTFLHLTLLSLPTILNTLLPIAAFAATVYVTNRLSSESELVVVQAAGYSPYRLARPVIVFGLFVALLVGILSHILVPMAQRELELRRNEIAQDVTARLLTEGTFVHPIEGVTFYVRTVTAAGELENIYFSNTRSEGARQSFMAREALIVKDEDGPKLLMFDGMSQIYQIESNRLSVTRFDSFVYSLSDLINEDSVPDPSVRSSTSFELLRASPAQMQTLQTNSGAIVAEVNERMNRALQGIAISLVGFAALLVGGFSRFGLWKQILLAVVLLVIVKSLDNTVDTIINKAPDQWPLRYAPTVLAIAMAWGLLWKTAHPRLKGMRDAADQKERQDAA
ncbi:LptF/LptG family permease [Celeribacter litoreus]|uniref:LptF/LptG family permease n=1 Tax=Celeribacter litoreus TaxID=2876714 RepID=UPI001CCBE6F5|nr:LptF/LptG family permease [Celeribacter litoreus]MCA0043704.1 LptF/LptG family permease [Celeribacter litoreus]